MKKTVTLALTLALLLGTLSGCATDTPADNAESTETSAQAENFSDEMKIPYATDLSPEDGADSVERAGDHENSPYFAHPDVYNMESTDTLTVLHNFKTQQQTSEWSCGVTSALMVLEWYDMLGDWNEETLAALRHSLDGTDLEGYPGTTLAQAVAYYQDHEPKGEYVLVLSGAEQTAEGGISLEEGVALVLKKRDAGLKLKDAVRQVSADTGLGRNELYAAALQTQGERSL